MFVSQMGTMNSSWQIVGRVLSTLTITVFEAETLPALSVAVTVYVWEPSASPLAAVERVHVVVVPERVMLPIEVLPSYTATEATSYKESSVSVTFVAVMVTLPVVLLFTAVGDAVTEPIVGFVVSI